MTASRSSSSTRAIWMPCLAVGLAVTLSVIFVPALRFTYRNPGLHVVLDTAEAMIGLLVAFVMYGRFRSSGEARALAIVLGLATLGVTNLFFSAVPEVTIRDGGEAFQAWGPLATRFIGAVAFATGAFLPARIRLTRSQAMRIAVVFVIPVAAFVGALFAAAAGLPEAIDPGIDPGASHRPLVVGHPTLLAAQVAMMIMFAAAAGAFLRIAEELPDPIYRWFGGASILAAFARVNYFLFPSLYSDFVYVGDALRLGFYVLMLVAITDEIRSYWKTRADAEVLQVRNALARNLHDGLAQELVFIAAQTSRLVQVGARPEDLQSLNSAADRAVAEARRAIAALSRPTDQSLADAIAETAEEEARRTGTVVRLALDDGVTATPDQRESLVRITREAVKTAARQSNASLVTVTLEASDGIRLTITDDGQRPESLPTTMGSSMTGVLLMRERAQAIGARLYISDAPNGGTEMRVEVPWKN